MQHITKRLLSFRDFNSLENTLISRNKRPRMLTLEYIYIFPLVYVVPFIPIFHALFEESYPLILFFIVFLSGISFWNTAIFSFSFWSNFFPFIISSPLSLDRIIFYKYYRMVLEVLLVSIISMGIVWFTSIDFTLYLVFAAYNLGIGSLIVLFIASMNISRCALTKGVRMNFEGWGFTQYSVLYLNLLIPSSLFFILSDQLGTRNAKFILLGMSVIVFMFHRFFVFLIYKNFMNRKYKILTVFRGN